MENVKTEIGENWKQASKDLGIRIEIPYRITYKEKTIEVIAYLPDFGSKNGMVINMVHPPEFTVNPDLEQICQGLDLFYSSINAELYKTYDKKLYTETLVDWCYFGDPKCKPRWINCQ